MQVYNRKQECYGCVKCKMICPTQAIRMVRDEEGFLYPDIDDKKCIECGKCIDECIAKVTKETKEEISSVLACAAIDEEILSNSTSGGMFYLLAREVMNENGIVYGATYNNVRVEHIRIDKNEDLYRLQGTRYVQSSIENVLPLIEKDIEENRYILFSGTPCQVAAVKSMYKHRTDKLLLVELFCMGVPSPQIWEDYIAEKEQQFGKIQNVNCRDKRTGWNSSSIVFFLADKELVNSHTMDAYMKGFLQALYIRPSCHDCRYKGTNTIGDLKIGDFWGIANYDEKYKKSKGTSIVVVETEKGKQWIKRIEGKLQKEEIPYRFATVYNPHVEISKKPSSNRERFFEEYRKGTNNIAGLIEENLTPRLTSDARKVCQYPVVEGMLELRLRGKSSADNLLANGWKRIAIYGLGELGEYLFLDLKGTEVEIDCIVDKNYSRFPEKYQGIDVIGPHKLCERKYDCIIVSAVSSYNAILEVLQVQGVDLDKVISIRDIF